MGAACFLVVICEQFLFGKDIFSRAEGKAEAFRDMRLIHDPFLYLCKEGFWSQHLYHRAEGKHLYQKLCFPAFIVIDGAAVSAAFFQSLHLFLIAGKVQHGALQGISLSGDFQYQWVFAQGMV